MRVRTAFLDSMLASPAYAKRFSVRPYNVITALVGLDELDKREIIKVTADRCRFSQSVPDIWIMEACASIFRSLEEPFPLEVQSILLAIQGKDSLDLDEIRSLGRILNDLAPSLNPEEAQVIGRALLSKMKEESPLGRGYIAEAMSYLGNKLPERHAVQTANLLLETLSSSAQYYDTAILSGLMALRQKLPRETVERVRRELESKINSTSCDSVRNISSIVYGRTIDSDDADRALKAVLSSIDSGIRDHLSLDLLGRLYSNASKEVLLEEGGRTLPLFEVIEGENAYVLGRSFETLLKRLGNDQRQILVRSLLDISYKSSNPYAIAGIAYSIGRSNVRLEMGDMDRLFGKLVSTLGEARTVQESTATAFALGTFEDRLPSTFAESGVRVLQARYKETIDDRDKIGLIMAQAGLGASLPDEFTSKILGAFIQEAGRTPNPPCRAIAPLIRSSNLQDTIQVLKWPTCSQSDRMLLIKRVSQVVGNGSFKENVWSFSRWAKLRGLSPDSPPAEPTL